MFRVYRVPCSPDKTCVRLAEFGQVRAVFVNADFPYPEFSFEMAPTPEGSAQPDGRLVGWRTTDPSNLLLLMTPVTSDRQNVDPEAAAILRIDTARAVIVGTMGLNAALLARKGISADWRKQSREYRYELGASKDELRSVRLENGQTVWLVFYPEDIEVLENYPRTTLAILGALAALEGGEVGTAGMGLIRSALSTALKGMWNPADL